MPRNLIVWCRGDVFVHMQFRVMILRRGMMHLFLLFMISMKRFAIDSLEIMVVIFRIKPSLHVL